jgi:FixJ family two-component response regulator
MPSRKPNQDTRTNPAEVSSSDQRLGVMVVAPGGACTTKVRNGLEQIGVRHTHVEHPDDLAEAATGSFDVILVSTAGSPGGLEVAERLRVVFDTTSIMLFSGRPTLAEATEALRIGACDIVPASIDPGELLTRIETAAERTHTLRSREHRMTHLQNLCKQLNSARQEVTRHVGSLCDDLVNAYQDLSDQIGNMSVSAEFGSIIRQELDIEELLRVVLEYVLGKCGPMNAGVFLPSTSGDFSLGAYVNYDCNKDSAEALLDHLADVVAPRFEHETEIVLIDSPDQLEQLFEGDAHWLCDRSVVVFSCMDEGECLAVVTLFRDQRKPFTLDMMPTLRTIADQFGEQLARVIRTHHRHLPQDQWGAPGDPEDLFDLDDDDIDLAA